MSFVEILSHPDDERREKEGTRGIRLAVILYINKVVITFEIPLLPTAVGIFGMTNQWYFKALYSCD